MKLLLYVAIVSTCGASPVVFEHRESKRPCNDTTVEFTISSTATETKNSFRLGSTNTVFDARVIDDDNCGLTWYSRLKVEETQLICDFFVNQKYFIEDIRSYPILQNLELTLVYLFDTEARKVAFRFYIKGLLYSIFADGVTKRFRNPGLSEELRDIAKEFAKGKAIDMLKERVKELKEKWYRFCVKWEREKNTTDKYTIWYNADAKMVYCSIQSGLPWWHNVSFHKTSSRTHRSYTGNRFMTFANAHIGDRSDFMCFITSPNGMVGIQNFTLPPGVIKSRPTPDPLRTAAATTPFDTDFAATTGFKAGSDLLTSGRSTAVSVVIVAIVVIVCLAVCLFVFRERLRVFSRRLHRPLA